MSPKVRNSMGPSEMVGNVVYGMTANNCATPTSTNGTKTLRSRHRMFAWGKWLAPATHVRREPVCL